MNAVRALRTWLRISYRQQRWELILVVAGFGLATGAMLWVAGQVDATRSLREGCLSTATIQEACNGQVAQAWEAFDNGQQLLGLMLIAPEQVYAQGISADISDEEGYAHYASEADLRAGKPIGYDVAFVIPGRRYPEIAARESRRSWASGCWLWRSRVSSSVGGVPAHDVASLLTWLYQPRSVLPHRV